VLGDPAKPREAYQHLKSRMEAPRLFTDRWRETEVGLTRDVDLEKVRELLQGYEVEVQTTGWAVHIMHRGMDKLVGVRKACELLGVSLSEAAAIGDSDNDEMMIRECGFGVAVANAFEGTKRAASYVSSEPDGEGVIDGLRWLRLI